MKFLKQHAVWQWIFLWDIIAGIVLVALFAIGYHSSSTEQKTIPSIPSIELIYDSDMIDKDPDHISTKKVEFQT